MAFDVGVELVPATVQRVDDAGELREVVLFAVPQLTLSAKQSGEVPPVDPEWLHVHCHLPAPLSNTPGGEVNEPVVHKFDEGAFTKSRPVVVALQTPVLLCAS